MGVLAECKNHALLIGQLEVEGLENTEEEIGEVAARWFNSQSTGFHFIQQITPFQDKIKAGSLVC